MSCTICGKATGPGALLCRPCKAALKRARQFTVLEIPGMAPTVTMPGGLPMPPSRPMGAPARTRRPRAAWRTLAGILVAVLAATAGMLFAIQHFARGAGSARAAESTRPAVTTPAPREQAAASAADLVPLHIAPRTLVTKPRVRPSVAQAAPPASESPPEPPAVTASVTTPQIATSIPAAAAPPPSSSPDRWQTMSDALDRCAREGGLGGFICDQRTRLSACEGFWGLVSQCPLPPENPH